jgi:hypothetical protein
MQLFQAIEPALKQLGSLWWIPLILWVLFFFWCRQLAYPQYLERKIREGRQWIYVPISWPRRRGLVKAGTVAWILLAGAFSASALYAVLPLGWAGLFAYLALALVFGVCLLFGFSRRQYQLQHDYYYQIYRQLEEAAYKEGRVMRKNDIENQCMWQHQSSLRQADKEGRLVAHLKGKAELR